MLKKLDLYLDMNEIPSRDRIVAVGEMILNNLGKKLITYTRYDYILTNFKSMALGNITDEEFFQLGDVACTLDICNYGLNLESLFEIYALVQYNSDEVKNALIIIENKALIYFQNQAPTKYESLMDTLHDQKSILAVL